MDKAGLYLRLSKEDVEKDNREEFSQSIVNQKDLLEEYALSHNYLIEQIYADDDYSGLFDDRPGFSNLIEDCRTGKINVVIAKSQSRFTRNLEHVEKYLHHDFKVWGVRFIGVVDGADTAVKSNKKARQINGLTNEWYCEDLSDNIRAVFKRKMRNGQFIGSFAPYGYLKDPDNKYNFIIDDYAAKIVKRIYDLYLDGFSVRKIGQILEDDGVPNPTLYKKQQGLNYKNVKASEFSERYSLWSTTTIKRILKNEVYIGNLIQGACEKLSYKDKRVVAVPREKWIIVENHHEAIIPEELFYKVQKLSKSRRISYINQDGDKRVHVLAGKVKCQTCGSSMIKSGGVKNHREDWFMRCQLANKSRLKECTSHSIRYSVIVNAVLEDIQNLVEKVLDDKVTNQEFEDFLKGDVSNDDEMIRNEKLKEANKLETDIADKVESLKLLYFDRTKNLIDDNLFAVLKDNIENDMNKLNGRLDNIKQELVRIEKRKDAKNTITSYVGRYCDYSKLTHQMVIDFIDYIEIGERCRGHEQEIIIHWNL